MQAHTALHKPAGYHAPVCFRCRRPKLGSHVPLSGPTAVTTDSEVLWGNLKEACEQVRRAPLSEKLNFSINIRNALEDLKESGQAPKWGAAATDMVKRRNVFQGELKQVGIKEPGNIAKSSTRNDMAFLVTVTGVTSVLAVVAGQLPGDWGFFSSYLIGGITLGVLAVGSTAPGLLQGIIDKFSQVYPDYRQRVVQHEAAHFLVGYLMGVPVTNYSLSIGQEHTEFAEAKIQKRIIERQLEDEEIDQLALVAVAGIAAEGQNYEEVMGQTADLLDLQRLLLRSKTKLSDNQQQNITRWAVFSAANLLRQYKEEFQAVQEGMSQGASVSAIMRSIEQANS